MRRFPASLMAPAEDTFAQLVSLAVHDLRTPLATIFGFARTLERADLGEPATQYVGMMIEASAQLSELLDDVGLAARIESGRWDANVREVNSLELARRAADALDGAEAAGAGGTVVVDAEAAAIALRRLADCALRHGGVERVDLIANGSEVQIAPVAPEAGPVLIGERPRDLGALVAARIVGALGGRLELGRGWLAVRLPA